ncbi:nitrate reductase [Acidithiobacillus sp.]|jgi:assimilatory nitrate reductase catalytic subunit|uniref:nitrate reductase n=1 Tax=Acidithiobacillus sp. TaxID=1872118 RepID=UPI0025C1A783|nr:nitrate reductase [Acidithiobacillus sp.]MCK9189443.1 molybdopterin-dependent oxidoreductase [Acidithiobacillus sp.]MCK9358988.1 molybdopterin-dependent oxidoreductase [Acidithiobacillus sp.]
MTLIRPQPLHRLQSKSVCPYCGTGCGVIIEHDGQHITGVRGDPDHPANFGQLCSKGSNLHLSSTGEDRAREPLRRQRGSEDWSSLNWSEALTQMARTWAGIIHTQGPQAVAFYVSGQLPTEDYYLVNKLAKGFIGTNHIDTNSRLCMASAVTGYKSSLGMDSVPCCYEDLDSAACLFIVGANVAYAHPILFRRIEAAKLRRPELQIIVADPRRTPTAAIADVFLPIQPGTDVALFHGMLHILIWEGLVNRTFIEAHTEGWEELKALVQNYTPQRVAEICAIPLADLRAAALAFGQAPAALSLWCQGLNQSSHGSDKNVALINLHLATGQIGRPGAGPFSLTGQPNAMGGRETGGMPALLPGHREVANPEHRAEIAEIWGVESLHPQPGLTAVPLFQALERGEIATIWITCTNPVLSMPDQTQVQRALEKSLFVILQDSYLGTETAAYADLLLPAASWGEREALVTNSERRITHLQTAVPAPGSALPDWVIFRDFAFALGKALDALDHPLPGTRDASWAERARRMFDFSDSASIFLEYRECTRGRDLDITGLDFSLLDEWGPQQWPYPQGAQAGQARLYADGIFPTPSGRARFRSPEYVGVAEEIDARYPLRLTTGRLRDQWHSMSRTGKVAALFASDEEAFLEIHPDDAQHLNLSNDVLARVSSRRGSNILRVRINADLQPGLIFAPMHFGRRFAPAALCNQMTLAAIDPSSGEPEFKHTAVRVEPVIFPWQGTVLRLNDQDIYFHAAQRIARQFPYASLSRIRRGEREGFILRLAGDQAPAAREIHAWDQGLGMDDIDILDYEDGRRGVRKRLCIRGNQLYAARLFGEDTTRDWLRELLLSATDVQSYRHTLFAPKVPLDMGAWVRSRGVCACTGVDERTLRQHIEAGAVTLGQIAQVCGAGGECGSCKPEIIHIISRMRQEAS